MDKRIIAIFATVFVNLLGFGIILPLLPYYAESLGASPITIGFLFASFSLFQLISAPILGEISDKIGRRPVLLFSIVGTIVSFILLGFANTIPLLFLARIVDGISGGNIATAQAYIADITEKKDRTKNMGYLAAAFGLGFIFGPSLGGLLAQFGYSVPAFVAAGISFIALILTYLFVPETVKIKSKISIKRKQIFKIEDFKTSLKHPSIGIVLGVYLIYMTAFSILHGTFALFAEHQLHLTVTDIGFIFAYIGVVSIFTQLFLLKRLLKLTNEKTLAFLGLLLMAVAFFTIPLSPNISFLILSVSIIAFGSSIVNPVLSGIISKLASPNEQGNVMGVFQSVASLGRLIGPIFGTLIFQMANPSVPYFIASGMVVGSALLGVIRVKSRKN